MPDYNLTDYQKEIIRKVLTMTPEEKANFRDEDYPKEDIDNIKRVIKQLLDDIDIRDQRLKELGMK